MNKIVINFTPTGMIPRKSDNPCVPINVEDIVKDVKKAYKLGITMVHLHARDAETEMSTHRKEVYGEIIDGIKAYAPDLIICVSTSGRINKEFATRSQVLFLEGDLKPDMASLTLSSLNFNNEASINEPETIIALAKEMLIRGIKPELEIFDLGMVNYANYLIKKEIIKPPFYANLILGNINSAQPDLIHIGCLVKDLPADTVIALGGVGKNQLLANSLAIALGYGVRVGLEDNLWFDVQRTKLTSNLRLLQRIHRLIETNEKQVMPSKELREILKL